MVTKWRNLKTIDNPTLILENSSFPKSLYPFNGKFLDLNGNKYHYLDEGRGEPVIMLHGNPTWSFYYRNLILSLRKSYRTIVPDHIGCGLSDKPDDTKYEYTLEQRVKDLDYLLKHLNVKEKITLIVHDWGGMIGMAYAALNKEQIKKIVILNTGGFHLPQKAKLPIPLRIIKDTPLGSFLVRRLNLFVLSAIHLCCKKKPMSEEIKKGYLFPYSSWENRIGVLRFVQDIPIKKEDKSYDIVSNVEKHLHYFSDTPVLICWGEKDFVFNKYFLKEWIKYLPNAEIHKFPDAGHYILEDEGSRIVSIINNFLRNNE